MNADTQDPVDFVPPEQVGMGKLEYFTVLFSRPHVSAATAERLPLAPGGTSPAR